MIFSKYNYDTKLYTYYRANADVPPYGWHRKPTPGTMKQPEVIAARLPRDAVAIGTGLLPQGLIATDMPGIGTVDTSTPSGAGAGLAGFGGAFHATRPAYAVPRLAGDDDGAWESADSRGYTERIR